MDNRETRAMGQATALSGAIMNRDSGQLQMMLEHITDDELDVLSDHVDRLWRAVWGEKQKNKRKRSKNNGR